MSTRTMHAPASSAVRSAPLPLAPLLEMPPADALAQMTQRMLGAFDAFHDLFAAVDDTARFRRDLARFRRARPREIRETSRLNWCALVDLIWDGEIRYMTIDLEPVWHDRFHVVESPQNIEALRLRRRRTAPPPDLPRTRRLIGAPRAPGASARSARA